MRRGLSFWNSSISCKFFVCFQKLTEIFQTQLSLVKMSVLFFYLSLGCSDLMILCYFAELLKYQVKNPFFLFSIVFYNKYLKSSRATEALMRSDWETFDGPTKRGMIIFMINARKPIQLVAGKILNLDMKQFLAAMKTVFSYYTLLKNFREKLN